MKCFLSMSALLLLFNVASGQAATITGLFNSGTDASDLALAGGDGVVDTHYSIVSSTSGPSYAGQQAVTYFNGAYAAEDTTSRWVSLGGDGNPGNNTTTYRTTFSLTGFNPQTATISGSFGADNQGEILLNGASTGVTTSNFGSLLAFTISSGFVSGQNTLDFDITDFGPPTAFRVDNLAGSAQLASLSTVPLPAALPMFGGAIVVLTAFGFGKSRGTRGLRDGSTGSFFTKRPSLAHRARPAR